MKKLAVLCMALLLIVSTMAGCNSKPAEGDASTVILQEGYTLQSIIDKMNEEIGIQMPMTVDDAVLEDIFHVNPDDIEEYYGIFGGSMTSADNAVAVKAKEGKADAVAESLNQRLEDVRASLSSICRTREEKAKKGQVIQKGDYVFLVIIGQDYDTFDSDMEKAQGFINEAFGS